MKLLNLFSFILCSILLTSVNTSSKVLVDDKNNLDPAKSSEILNVKPKPPLIIYPEEISEFRGINKIEFKWHKVQGAAWYHLILARDRDFKKIIHENNKVDDTSYTIANLDYGTHFFKISSVTSDGTEGPFSNTLSFIIVPHPPLSIPVIIKK
jgi:hypothetical protein